MLNPPRLTAHLPTLIMPGIIRTMKIVACNSNLPLAEAVATELGMPLCNVTVRRFADMEVFVEIHENVRGEDVFVVQSTCTPTNDNLMELLIMLDALRRGSARRITAVMPYFGYARQDRKSGPRTPISAKLVANLLVEAGANRVLTLDLHAMQIQGFFDIPVDNLYAAPLFVRDIKERYGDRDLMIVSPDVGGVVRARQLAQRLNTDLAIIDKRRERAGVSEVMNVIGDVKGRHCLLVDDIVDSGGSLCNAAQAIFNNGAASVGAYVTHGVLTGSAVERISNSCIEMLTLTDSIKATESVTAAANIRQITIAGLLARAMRAVSDESSVSSLFD
ncbi:ribose-phosphate pyrophosphokinase [Acetobacter tropicalis]|uniref:Ribose-phosphate pyrophosphokinase n=3 Tax=Acetobacter tropicalis TaxID=104102 RepID=A0A511FQP7_9PROT|nr:ribose-phosphate pyrophosphokinase [Acetobacter tropicalis]